MYILENHLKILPDFLTSGELHLIFFEEINLPEGKTKNIQAHLTNIKQATFYLSVIHTGKLYYYKTVIRIYTWWPTGMLFSNETKLAHMFYNCQGWGHADTLICTACTHNICPSLPVIPFILKCAIVKLGVTNVNKWKRHVEIDFFHWWRTLTPIFVKSPYS